MQLDTSRFFSDRLIFTDNSLSNPQVINGFWECLKRIIYWFSAPTHYSEQNKRSVECFQTYLIGTLGKERLQRISARYELNWEEMKKSPLLSRDIAKILIGAKSVRVEDINEHIQKNRGQFGDVKHFFDLEPESLAEIYKELSSCFDKMWQVAEITDRITGRPTEWLSSIFYDPLLADRERLQVVKDHPKSSFDLFMHNMVARVIKRDPPVGTLIPAPNKEDGSAQFYYVSAKLVTGQGMVSYILHPAGRDTALEPIRLFRGSVFRNSEFDALPTLINDLEPEIGWSAYESGKPYEKHINALLSDIKIEAGHSLGSTILQHRLVNGDNETIKKAYLYAGPGISEASVKKFNQKNQDVELAIGIAENDPWSQLGEAHLGYQAPNQVKVNFKKYCPIGETSLNPHVTLWESEPKDFKLAENVSPQERDKSLYHKNGRAEYYRQLIGPIFARGLKALSDFFRYFFNCRIHTERGLQIGYLRKGIWRIDHFRCENDWQVARFRYL